MFNTAGLDSCNRGMVQIDGVWSIDDRLPTHVSLLSYRFRVGDRRVILVDFEINDWIWSSMNTLSTSMKKLT